MDYKREFESRLKNETIDLKDFIIQYFSSKVRLQQYYATETDKNISDILEVSEIQSYHIKGSILKVKLSSGEELTLRLEILDNNGKIENIWLTEVMDKLSVGILEVCAILNSTNLKLQNLDNQIRQFEKSCRL